MRVGMLCFMPRGVAGTQPALNVYRVMEILWNAYRSREKRVRAWAGQQAVGSTG